MKKITKSLLIALGFGLLAVALGFLTSSPAPAQAPPPTVPVTVRNTTAQPVPTSAVGTTAVSGSVIAMQSAPWLVRAAQIAPWSVNVSNSLNGSNRVPLIVQDVDSPGRYPFSIEANGVGIGSGASVALPSTTASGAPVQTVVIEFVSALCQEGTAPGDIYLKTQLAASPLSISTTEFFLTATGNGVVLSNPNGWTEITVAQQTKIYADPGTQAFIGTPFPNNGCILSLSGHLIPQ